MQGGIHVFVNTVSYSYHGCKDCLFADIIHPQKQVPYATVYQDTLDREDQLKENGRNLVTIWEHDFRKMLKDPEVKSFIDQLKFPEQLNPRDAFFGGRTNATRLHLKCDDTLGQEIRYHDVISE